MPDLLPPWMVLFEHLPYHPTLPFLMGVLRARELLPNSGDHFADGLLLLKDMEHEQLLDKVPKQMVSIELCVGDLRVPVFHLRERDAGLYIRSQFPSIGSARGRLRFDSLVEKTKISTLEECYERFFHNPKFQHDFALGQGRLSRDGRNWATLEDTTQFDEAVDILDQYRESLRAVVE